MIEPLGGLFANYQLTAGNVQLVVAPTNNLAGIIIRSLSMQVASSGSGVLYADTTAPPSSGSGVEMDLTRRFVAEVGTGSTGVANMVLPYPLWVPPGLGLWFAANSTAFLAMTYDFGRPS